MGVNTMILGGADYFERSSQSNERDRRGTVILTPRQAAFIENPPPGAMVKVPVRKRQVMKYAPRWLVDYYYWHHYQRPSAKTLAVEKLKEMGFKDIKVEGNVITAKGDVPVTVEFKGAHFEPDFLKDARKVAEHGDVEVWEGKSEGEVKFQLKEEDNQWELVPLEVHTVAEEAVKALNSVFAGQKQEFVPKGAVPAENILSRHTPEALSARTAGTTSSEPTPKTRVLTFKISPDENPRIAAERIRKALIQAAGAHVPEAFIPSVKEIQAELEGVHGGRVLDDKSLSKLAGVTGKSTRVLDEEGRWIYAPPLLLENPTPGYTLTTPQLLGGGSSFTSDARKALNQVYNTGLGVSVANFLGYTPSEKDYEKRNFTVDVGGITSALDVLGDPLSALDQSYGKKKSEKVTTELYIPTAKGLAKEAATGVILGAFSLIDLPMMAIHAATDARYRRFLAAQMAKMPAQAAANPIGEAMRTVTSFIGAGMALKAYESLPARPKVTLAKVGDAKAVSVGVQTRKGSFYDYHPLITISKGSDRIISRVPRVDITKVLKGKYVPQSPFETKIIINSLDDEVGKVVYARNVRRFTVDASFAPSELKPIIQEVVKAHRLPEEAADVIINELKKNNAVLYGSAIQKASGEEIGTVTLLRTPHDFDVAVANPPGFAKAVAEAINKVAGRKVVKADGSKVIVRSTGAKLFDIHSPTEEGYGIGLGEPYLGYGLKSEPVHGTEEGLRVITLSEQASRKLRGAVQVRPELDEWPAEFGWIKGRLLPEHTGRVKDIMDYYLAERGLIEALKLKGKETAALKAQINLDLWLDSWGQDVATAIRRTIAEKGVIKVPMFISSSSSAPTTGGSSALAYVSGTLSSIMGGSSSSRTSKKRSSAPGEKSSRGRSSGSIISSFSVPTGIITSVFSGSRSSGKGGSSKGSSGGKRSSSKSVTLRYSLSVYSPVRYSIFSPAYSMYASASASSASSGVSSSYGYSYSTYSGGASASASGSVKSVIGSSSWSSGGRIRGRFHRRGGGGGGGPSHLFVGEIPHLWGVFMGYEDLSLIPRLNTFVKAKGRSSKKNAKNKKKTSPSMTGKTRVSSLFPRSTLLSVFR